MEEDDPESEWEIQEYSSSKEVETSMMRWILNKGYGIGKKMIITGIAISAAPLVLPPILVFSVMGVAFSVPSGLVFATYACTNKLMRMLLPTPPSPVLLLEYYCGDEQVKEEEEGIELGDHYRRVEKGYCIGEYGDDYGREVECLVTNVDGNTDEKGYCYTDEEEGVDVVFKLEDVGEEFRQYVGASVTNVDENEEEKVQLDDYEEEGEGLIMNVDEIVVERSYYTNENEDEIEIEDVVVPRENLINEEEVEQMEDMKQGVEMRLEVNVESITNSDEGGVGKRWYSDENKDEILQPDDNKEEGEALVMNVDEVFDEKISYTNENDGERVMEDDILLRESVLKEEEVEQMEDIKQEVEMRLGLDVGLISNSDENIVGKGHIEEVQPDDYEQEREAAIMYVDEKSYNIDDEKAIEDDVLQRENAVKEEETKQMEDIKQGVEMRLGLDVGSITNSDKYIVEKGCFDDVNKEELQADHYNEGGEALLMNVDDIEDEKSNVNDDENEIEDRVFQRENVTKDEKSEKTEDIKQEVETSLGLGVGSITNFGGGVDEQGYEEDVGEYLQGDDDSLGEENMWEDLSIQMYEIKNNIQEDEKEEVVEESTGLLEESPSVASEEVKDAETTEPVIVKEIDSENLIQNGSKDNECVGELRHVVILAGGNEGNNFNSREVEELDLVAREVVGDNGKDGSKDESDVKVMRESMGTQEKTVSDRISNDGAKDVILETKKDELISSNADAREISNENASMNFENLEAGGEMKKNGAHENVDLLALPASRHPTLDADNWKITNKNDTNMPTKEDKLDDENIWEKIGAMRAIVGYKVQSQPTCIEELKALYVFTGVEPPVSFNVDSGLDEVNDKLKFLMSIVGVK